MFKILVIAVVLCFSCITNAQHHHKAVKPLDTMICHSINGDSVCAFISTQFPNYNTIGTLSMFVKNRKFWKSYFITDTGSVDLMDFQNFEDSCTADWGQPMIASIPNEITYLWYYVARTFQSMEATLTYKFKERTLQLIIKATN